MDLERLRREAEAQVREGRHAKLADAQLALAREHGEHSWAALVARAEGARILDAALAGEHARAVALAAERPKAAAAARVAGGAELLRVAAEGDAAAVYALLELRVDPNVRDASGATALHAAARAGRLDVLDVLVGWVPTDRAARDASGRTPSEVAGDPAARRLLAGAGAGATAAGAFDVEACAIEPALLAWLSTSPRAERRPVGDGFAVRTGLSDNTRNGVVASAASGAEVAAALDWLGAPGQWHVGEGSALGPALERAGCEREDAAVYVGARVEDLVGASVAAEPVRDYAGLRAAFAAVGRHAGDPARRDAELSLLGSLGVDGPLRHFVVGDDALATTFTREGLCLLEDVTVAPAARRRGLGSGLALHALRASGARVALAWPTPGTAGFFAALGLQLSAFPPGRVFSTP